MKIKFFRVMIMLLCCLLLTQGCTKSDPDKEPADSEDGSPTSPNDQKHYYEDAIYVYQSDVEVNLLLTGLSPDYLLLANKTYVLGADYRPTSLVTLTCRTTYSMKLESRAAYALYEMLDEMAAAGIDDISVTSAYRTYQYQSDLFEKYKKIEMNTITSDARLHLGDEYINEHYTSQGKTQLNEEDAISVVLSYSALPGTSEHQTGLCVDFITSSMGGQLTTKFEESEAFDWLSENAYKFGFILRYPKGKESVTQYTYEPWHYRFVGREAATDIYFGDLTLEEYLGATEVDAQ